MLSWLSHSPGVFVLVAGIALLLSWLGPVWSRAFESLERRVWHRPQQPVSPGIRTVSRED